MTTYKLYFTDPKAPNVVGDAQHMQIATGIHTRARAGDMLELIHRHHDGSMTPLTTVPCVLSQQVTVQETGTIVHGRILTGVEEQFFAFGCGFETIDQYRRNFLPRQSPFSGVLLAWT